MTTDNGQIRDRIKSLRRVRVSELQVHPKNFRKHGQSQRRAMSAALQEIGFADALLVRETDSGLQIIDGHLRADLAKDQKVPVLVLDVDEQEADKLLATFDAITGLAEIDEDLLRSLTDGLEFETPELDELVAGLLGDETADITEDKPPEAQDGPSVAQVGDVWACGRHRVLCGDCTDETTVAALMGDTKASLLMTDPPYGPLRIFKDGTVIGKANAAPRGEYDPALYHGEGVFDLAPLLAATTGHYDKSCIWGGNYFADKLPITTNWIVWDKRAGDRAFFSDCELAWCSCGDGMRIFSHVWQGMIRAGECRKRTHPTQKPVELIARVIEHVDDAGDTVLDVCLGSGTTLIAAEQLGRTCYGIEIEPRYVDVILRRYMNFTNVSPVRKSDGVLFSELVKGEPVHA